MNPLRTNARRLLGNPQAMHAAVLGGVPRQPARERMLWRLDMSASHRPELFVLTRSLPSWEHVVEQAGWPSADDPDDPQVVVRDYKPLLDRLAPGQEYAFRLTANPTRSTKRPQALTPTQQGRAVDGSLPRSVRLGHRTVASQAEWFLIRLSRWGFDVPRARSSVNVGEDIPDARVIDRQRLTFARLGSPGRVVLQKVTYEGRLRVTDADALRSCLVDGIGPAKAYGCGLLTLAPLVR